MENHTSFFVITPAALALNGLTGQGHFRGSPQSVQDHASFMLTSCLLSFLFLLSLIP